jgi:ubiquinone biosynthesis protein
MFGLFNFTMVMIFSGITILMFAWTLRGLLGVQFSLVRLVLAGILTFSLVTPIINALPGSYDTIDPSRGDPLYPAVLISLLGMVISILIGMFFLVVAEALVPSDTIPGPMYMARAARMWLQRTQRYMQISWILLKHGVSLGSIGGNRAQMRSAEGRAFLAGKMRDALSESGVTFIKLGQILSTRRDLLPPEFIDAFSTLQTRARPLSWPEMHQAIATNLIGRKISDVFSHIEHEPLASASVAQVHSATLVTGEDVVLKIRRPGIRHQVEQDLDIVDRMAMQLERSTSWGRDMGARDLSAGFAVALREELDLTVEARNMRVISAASRPGDPQVPCVYSQFSTSSMLVMERVNGVSLGNVNLRDVPGDREQMADNLFEALLHQMLVVGTFHTDPHPGNIMLLPDGSLTLLDFGSVGRIDKVTRTALVRMLLAWEFDDPVSATDALLVMVERPMDLDERALERDMGAFMATHTVPGATIGTAAVADLFSIVSRNGLTMPPELAAALRTFGTIEGTLSWLVADYNIIAQARIFAERYMKGLMRPTSLKDAFTEELVRLLPLLQRLPRRIDRITAAMEEGRLMVNVSALSNARDEGVIRGLMQELLLTVLAAASGVMAVLLISQDEGPMLVPTMTVFQFMGYFLLVLAFILAMRVLIFVFRRTP